MLRPHPLLLLICLVALSCTASADEESRSPATPRNVILFVADGAGPAHITMGRELARHLGLRDQLYLDAHQVGSVRTHSAKERVTDSASSATAYSTGFKTYNGAIAVDTLEQPIRTIVEAAEEAGLATGLVATSRITHATPASFGAHVRDRNMEVEIAAQMIERGIDVLLGGGRSYFVSEDDGGSRKDGRNLLDEAASKGYTVVSDAAGLSGVQATPVLGLFAPSHLPYEVDGLDSDHLDLASMTAEALRLLEGTSEGFFLLVEGSRIDHASHDNDPAAALREMIAYDEAFEVARRFAEENGETLVIAVSDHETGGLSAGRSALLGDDSDAPMPAPTFWRGLYGSAVYDWRPDVLADVSASTVALAATIGSGTSIDGAFGDHAGIGDLTPREREAVGAARESGVGLVVVLGEIVARRAGVGWTTTGHTAVDVNLYAYGAGSEELRGNVDNTQIGLWLFDALELEPGPVTTVP